MIDLFRKKSEFAISALPVPLILASTSPRRISLLKQLDLQLEVHPPDADETPLKGETPANLVKRLALKKASSVRPIALNRFKRCLILSADTIVVAPDGKVLGKPKDKSEAAKMLRKLSGRTHVVLTGYCLLLVDQKKKDLKIIRLVRSKVKMRTLLKPAIETYILTGEPMDKAGGYAAQGKGMAFIEAIQGSYTNVVGLPLSQVIQDVEQLFKRVIV